MKRKVWTWGYFPDPITNQMCNYPITTMVKVKEEQEIGKGYKAFSFEVPFGILIAESVTGAIVGDNWNDVKNEIKKTSIATIRNQIKMSWRELNKGSKSLFLPQFLKMVNEQNEQKIN